MYHSRTDLAVISEKILSLVSADEAELRVSEGENLNLRSADNDVTTNGLISELSVTLTVSFGKRSASISINQVDETTLREAVKRVEAMARLAPEDPEYLPPVKPPSIPTTPIWADATAAVGPGESLNLIQPVIDACRAAGVSGASYLQRVARISAYANSKGGYIEEKSTRLDYSLTARTSVGRGSGWASVQVTDADGLDLLSAGERAISKALASRDSITRPPGRTTVVLEAAAARDLLDLLSWSLDRREFDEGQSFLNSLVSKGEDPIGQRLFSEITTLTSDPFNPVAPCSAHQDDFLRPATTWIEKGVLKNLPVGRFWAQKRGLPLTIGPGNLLFPGEGKSIDNLISTVEEGVLVTRFWYLRMVRPESLLYTGLTRDGTFAIRDGKIIGPVNNYRFNESPVNVLKNLVATGISERVLGSESESPVLAPPMVVRDFNLSSISDAS